MQRKLALHTTTLYGKITINVQFFGVIINDYVIYAMRSIILAFEDYFLYLYFFVILPKSV